MKEYRILTDMTKYGDIIYHAQRRCDKDGWYNLQCEYDTLDEAKKCINWFLKVKRDAKLKEKIQNFKSEVIKYP